MSATHYPDSTGSFDRTVRLWDVPNGYRWLRTLEGHDHALVGLAFRPDGRQLAAVGYRGSLKVWDTATGAELRTIP